jgi:hypothetical protein
MVLELHILVSTRQLFLLFHAALILFLICHSLDDIFTPLALLTSEFFEKVVNSCLGRLVFIYLSLGDEASFSFLFLLFELFLTL